MNPWLAFLLGALVLGPFVGAGLFLLLGESTYRRGVLAGQRQAALASQGCPVISDGWNPAETPRRRRRSPDTQLVTRPAPTGQPDRPVFHR